ncbi:tyrosyl-tRNA synthetase, putative [Schistosoma mansoni]|uniref:tyrosyl-tRNA synthetase, putative n=1 Tax=Schistosoma mansoni TaxID=6183 RepID=UPI0001A62B3B|nr:tyrosyl-tRNA synthetase, putative [Schistosoma mansoni]|eukprot:XP_018646988.1 tyrosyl-tRNA synthetase, putative [Schistosoma mansoni]
MAQDYVNQCSCFLERLTISSEKHLLDFETTRNFSVYAGFDPTCDSLQLGNLVAVCGLLRCHLSGKDIVAVVGGSTGILGDPSGRIKKRDYQSLGQYASNSTLIEHSLDKIIYNYWTHIVPALPISGKLGSVHVVNNSDWLTHKKVMDVSCEVLPHFKLSELLEKESVKIRMESGNTMDLGEFFYPIVQAIDFLYLHEKFNCYMQVGGHDQIGNITCGLNLIYRKLGRRAFGLTVPLLTTPDGQKLGKSVSNSECGMDTIWLMSKKLKPYNFYQKILNLPDSIISDKLVRQLTFFGPDEIDQLLTDHKEKLVSTFLAYALQASELATRIFFPMSSVNCSDDNLPLDKSSMEIIQNELNSSERHYLLSCLEPSSQFLPVIYPKNFTDSLKSSGNNYSQLLESVLDLIMLTSNFKDRSEALQTCFTRGVVLNSVNLLKKGSKFEISPENIQAAFSRFDQTTGLGILRLGKNEHWFVATRSNFTQ